MGEHGIIKGGLLVAFVIVFVSGVIRHEYIFGIMFGFLACWIPMLIFICLAGISSLLGMEFFENCGEIVVEIIYVSIAIFVAVLISASKDWDRHSFDETCTEYGRYAVAICSNE